MKRLLPVMLLGLCAGAALAAEFEVRQSDRMFVPDRLVVARGSVVHFANDEPFVHHAFVDTAEFKADTGDIPPGEVRDIVFGRSGTYVIRCAIHPQMKMTIEVSAQD